MSCGCRKNRSATARPTASAPASSGNVYEVWIGGSYSGRRFTSLISAQSYANRTGGEIRTV